MTYTTTDTYKIPLNDVARCLTHFQGAGRLVGTIHTSLVIQRRYANGYDVWTLTDNGGEINVERINEPDTLRSVAATYWSAKLNAATLAYRVACAMRGDAIDYEYRLTDDDQARLLSTTREG
jgi:hypothetical protein